VAGEAGLSLDGISGSGPNDRILKADVDEALVAKAAQPAQAAKPAAQPAAQPMAEAPSAIFEDLTNSNIRKVIAERLTYSKQNIPHYYVTISVNVDALLAMRVKLNKVASTKISVNDFVIKAASMAATKVPETNS